MHVFTFDEFGKDFPKSLKLPPDGLLQNAILLTYYRYFIPNKARLAL